MREIYPEDVNRKNEDDDQLFDPIIQISTTISQPFWLICFKKI